MQGAPAAHRHTHTHTHTRASSAPSPGSSCRAVTLRAPAPASLPEWPATGRAQHGVRVLVRSAQRAGPWMLGALLTSLAHQPRLRGRDRSKLSNSTRVALRRAAGSLGRAALQVAGAGAGLGPGGSFLLQGRAGRGCRGGGRSRDPLTRWQLLPNNPGHTTSILHINFPPKAFLWDKALRLGTNSRDLTKSRW